MSDSWAISSLDLHLDLAGAQVRTGLEAALREAVRGGRLLPGTRLPSSRALATDLGINSLVWAKDKLHPYLLTLHQDGGTATDIQNGSILRRTLLAPMPPVASTMPKSDLDPLNPPACPDRQAA